MDFDKENIVEEIDVTALLIAGNVLCWAEGEEVACSIHHGSRYDSHCEIYTDFVLLPYGLVGPEFKEVKAAGLKVYQLEGLHSGWEMYTCSIEKANEIRDFFVEADKKLSIYDWEEELENSYCFYDTYEEFLADQHYEEAYVIKEC